MGVGSLISVVTAGKLIDWNYRRWAQRLGRPVVRNRQDDLSGFPIEAARLQVALPLLYLSGASIVLFGWLVDKSAHIAGPCVALFIFGYTLITVSNVMNILIVDTNPGKPATATAANNLVRCWLGAGATAAVVPLVNAIGIGWTCSLLAFIWIGFSPLLWLLMARGPRWRDEMKVKQQAKEEKGKVHVAPRQVVRKETEVQLQAERPSTSPVGAGTGSNETNEEMKERRL